MRAGCSFVTTCSFHGLWRSVTQQVVCLAALALYCRTEALLDENSLRDMAGLALDLTGAATETTGAAAFPVDLEDFLMGLAAISPELVRGVLRVLSETVPLRHAPTYI